MERRIEEPAAAASAGADDAAAASHPPASSVRVAAIAATMPVGLAAAHSVKMAGYLDKRGKRLPTWKRYWFVLDGRLLLYFGSQFDYLHQLSPCRGSLNLGLVSGVRPAGSARAASPQLEIATRSQAVLLRAKDRETQERWLQALLDAVQNNAGAGSGGTHFRYGAASLPQPAKKKNEERLVDGEVCLPKQIKQNQPNTAVLSELRNINTDSLRKVSSRTPTTKTQNRVADISAQLPTSTAVHRLLERRKQEAEEEHVTTIVIDPGHSSVAMVKTNGSGVLVTNDTAPSTPEKQHDAEMNDVEKSDKKTDISKIDGKKENTCVKTHGADPAAKNSKEIEEIPEIEVENAAYIGLNDEDLYAAVPAMVEYESFPNEMEYATMDEAQAMREPSNEPSLPPRPDDAKTKFTPSDNLIKRKKSFLERLLGPKKAKKSKINKKNIPVIKIESPDEYEENAAYETIDYEMLLKTGEFTEEPRVPDFKRNTPPEYSQVNKVTGNTSATQLTPEYSEISIKEEYAEVKKKAKDVPVKNKQDTAETEKNAIEYVNVNTMLNTPAESGKPAEVVHEETKENASNIVPIIENEKTHTVIITVQNSTPSPQEARPKLPPRRSSSSSSMTSDTAIRPVSPYHDVPTSNMPVVAKNKRKSDEYNDDNKHRTVISIACSQEVINLKPTEEIRPKSELCVDTHPQANKALCAMKHRSADELDILLCQLTKITNAPLHSASVDALGPLRRQRLGSDPDYDIPRPHNLYTGFNKRDSEDEKMEATRFFTEPDLYYARPLSEYLLELDRMSHVQEKRTSRASRAFHKWLEESPDLIPTTAEEDEDEEVTSLLENQVDEKSSDKDNQVQSLVTKENTMVAEKLQNDEQQPVAQPEVTENINLEIEVKTTDTSQNLTHCNVQDEQATESTKHSINDTSETKQYTADEIETESSSLSNNQSTTEQTKEPEQKLAITETTQSQNSAPSDDQHPGNIDLEIQGAGDKLLIENITGSDQSIIKENIASATQINTETQKNFTAKLVENFTECSHDTMPETTTQYAKETEADAIQVEMLATQNNVDTSQLDISAPEDIKYTKEVHNSEVQKENTDITQEENTPVLETTHIAHDTTDSKQLEISTQDQADSTQHDTCELQVTTKNEQVGNLVQDTQGIVAISTHSTTEPETQKIITPQNTTCNTVTTTCSEQNIENHVETVTDILQEITTQTIENSADPNIEASTLSSDPKTIAAENSEMILAPEVIDVTEGNLVLDTPALLSSSCDTKVEEINVEALAGQTEVPTESKEVDNIEDNKTQVQLITDCSEPISTALEHILHSSESNGSGEEIEDINITKQISSLNEENKSNEEQEADIEVINVTKQTSSLNEENTSNKQEDIEVINITTPISSLNKENMSNEEQKAERKVSTELKENIPDQVETEELGDTMHSENNISENTNLAQIDNTVTDSLNTTHLGSLLDGKIECGSNFNLDTTDSAGQMEVGEVKLRVTSKAKDDTVRLSFALADTEIICQETVGTLTSALYEIADA